MENGENFPLKWVMNWFGAAENETNREWVKIYYNNSVIKCQLGPGFRQKRVFCSRKLWDTFALHNYAVQLDLLGMFFKILRFHQKGSLIYAALFFLVAMLCSLARL